MNIRAQRFAACLGPVMVLLWLVAFVPLAHLVPPPSPLKTPAEVQAWISRDTTAVRIALVDVMLGCALLAPFYAVISAQMQRIEGRHSVWARTQFGLGMILIVLSLFPMLFLATMAFRPDRNPDTLQIFYDLTWLGFVAPVSTAAVQCFAIAIVTLSDTRTDPVFPRWGAYVNIWIGIMFIPGNLCVFFKTGPFAWQGLFAWWVPFVTFSCWYLVMAYLVLRAINQQQREEGAGPTGLGDTDLRGQLERLSVEVAELRRASAPARTGIS
jgi:hypothetical protein